MKVLHLKSLIKRPCHIIEDGVKYKSPLQIFEKDMRLHETRCDQTSS